MGMCNDNDPKAIALGHPSYVWRYGQDRRLALIRHYANLEQARILDVGCGLGAYVQRLSDYSDRVYGVDIDPAKVAEAQEHFPHIREAPAEELPFSDAFFDLVLLHEVLEHVNDDRQAVKEAYRVTRAGGRLVIFVPNRLYPFETHGVYWRGRYRFGNIPLVGYLPAVLRARLCPHVRAYTARSLRQLFDGLCSRIVVHTQIYPGYDNIANRRPRLASWTRRITYWLEHTPFRIFGLSHLLVVEKAQAS
jgi:SAM-dependent methyltransferase